MARTRYRALFRVIAQQDEGAWCVLPGWDSNVAILIPELTGLRENDRFHGVVYLGADLPSELEPSDFELEELR